MTRLITRLRNENGIAMIVAMGVLLVTLSLTAVVVEAATQLSNASNNDTKAKRALEAAEAGLQETTYRLNMLSPSAVASQVKCIGGVLDSVNLLPPTIDNGTVCDPYTEQLGNNAQFKTYVSTPFSTTGSCAGVQIGVSTAVVERCVTSTGTVGGVSRRVQARVAAGIAAPIFPIAGMVGFKSVTVGNVAVINGGEGSNGTISLSNNSTATSTILGPGGTVSVANGASPCTNANGVPPLFGCVTRNPSPFVPAVINFPNMVPPATLPDGNIRLSNVPPAPTDTLNGATWNATTRTLAVGNNGSVILGGGVYDFCTLSMANNSSITLSAAARTAIYIDSYNRIGSDGSHSCPAGSTGFSMTNNSSFINNSPPAVGGPPSAAHDSRALQLYIYDQANVTLSNNTDFYGTLYAPLSNVTVANNNNSYGAIVGNTVTLSPSSNTAFYADANDTTIGTQSIYLFFRTAWHECTVSPPTASDPQSGC